MVKQYQYRPAKAAQRRMIIDACRRLTVFGELKDYQYVGFGGLEFIDFEQFHLSLGVEKMTSIEHDEDTPAERYEFNKPYDRIELLFGEARDRLSDIDWTPLSIVWLDYLDQLTPNILRDVDYTVRSLQPGSVLVVTINGGVSTKLADRLPNLERKLGDLLPSNLQQKDMKAWGATRVQRRILHEHASSVGREAHGTPLKQIFNFEYADESKMLTWGAVVLSPALSKVVNLCGFDDLDFVRSDSDEPLQLRMPFLTEREMRHFERTWTPVTGLPKIAGLKPVDVADFRDVYRWRVGTR
jgi:hypothetical protein